MKTDALSDLLRGVDDDSSPEHKAIWRLAVALYDVDDRATDDCVARIVARGIAQAADELEASKTP